MKISVITPSLRPELIGIVAKCLKRQTLKDFEWLIGTPADCMDDMREALLPYDQKHKFVADPPKREGDYYSLNKCWNELIRVCEGELVVNIVDGLWFEPSLLERLWHHYEANPGACISCVGDQFSQLELGKPEGRVWRDPRRRMDFGSFYEVGEMEMEMCIASAPRQAFIDVGGFEEEFDRGAAVSEKELMARIYKAGYKLYIDQTLEYRAIIHPRLSNEWDKRYHVACDMWGTYHPLIESGKRLRLDYVKEKVHNSAY